MGKAIKSIVSIHILSLCAIYCLAQTGSSKPAPSNLNNAQYPRISSDLRVTFRIQAPDAKKVTLVGHVGPAENGPNGLGGPYELVKDQTGFWTVTTPPVVPGYHVYNFNIDGALVNELASSDGGIEVPEPGVDFYLLKEVPHGELRECFYESEISGMMRRLFVYTPPGYDASPNLRYPVLYLQHGGGQNETSWTRQGYAHLILDNLIAAGKAKPMIMVMMSGSAPEKGQRIQPPAAGPVWTWSDKEHKIVPPSGVSESLQPRAYQNAWKVPEANSAYERSLINEIIPFVDATFRTIPDARRRAMAGLSNGARLTMQATLAHLDKFSYIGVFSRPPLPEFDVKTLYGGVLANAAESNQKIKLLWFGAGTAEEGVWYYTKETLEALNKAGIKYAYMEYPGLGHEWQIWRKNLHDFAPLLFQ